MTVTFTTKGEPAPVPLRVKKANGSNGNGSAPPPRKDFSAWVAATHDEKDLVLGVEGFSYADLHRPERLADLTQVFDATLQARDAAAWAALGELRDGSAKARGPKALSDALIAATVRFHGAHPVHHHPSPLPTHP